MITTLITFLPLLIAALAAAGTLALAFYDYTRPAKVLAVPVRPLARLPLAA